MTKDVSIIIATFNSAALLPKVIASIQRQTYPRDRIEILLVDGGSKDETKDIARKLNCRIIHNPKTEPLHAKFLGYLHARGKYIVYLDHDEVMKNPQNIELKVSLLQKNKKVRAVVGSGYESPPQYAFINDYINEFGDPFSFFIYRLSKDTRYFLGQMKKRFPILLESTEAVIFDLSKASTLPIIELCAVGSMVDGEYMKKNFPDTLTDKSLIPHFFYLLQTKNPYLGMTKNDPLIHYSSDTLKKYIKKLEWRVKNNIYYADSMGTAGYRGRERYQPAFELWKKYLYLVYAFTFLLPLLDGLHLVLTRRKVGYLIHVPLVVYVAFLILIHKLFFIFGRKSVLRNYDGTVVVK